MPRPKASPAQYLDAYRLWKSGKGPSAIWRDLGTKYGGDAVSDRTVATWMKGFKDLDPETVDLDSPFEWRLMEKYGLPGEAGKYLMDIQYLIQMRQRSVVNDNEHVRNLIIVGTQPLSVREARLCWRIHMTAPEIGATVGVLSDVLTLAKSFATREMVTDVLAESPYAADLEALLIYRPWLDFKENGPRHRAYHEAVDEGIIPPLPSRSDLMLKGLNAWAGSTATTPTENIAGIIKAMDATAGYVSHEHPELLESQQRESKRDTSNDVAKRNEEEANDG